MSSWIWNSLPAKFAATESIRRLPFVLTFAFMSAVVIRITLLLDINKHVFSHKPGKCRSFNELSNSGAAYFENVEALRYLFASDGFHRLSNSSYNAGIYFLEYPKNNAKPSKQQQNEDPKFVKSMANLKFEPLSIVSNEALEFTPLGMSSYIEGSILQKKYRLFLYVVNARLDGPNSVEVFLVKIKERTLVHQYTVKDQKFTSLSDIVVLSAGRFVVSNVFEWSNRWLQLIEFVMQRDYGSLLLYNGKEVVPLISGLVTPNGLFWDSTTRRLYVSLTSAETVKIYNLRPDMSIQELTRLNFMSSPDHIYLNKATGELWITTHPVTHHLLRSLFTNFRHRSPSQVLRVRFQDKMDSWVITEPFANNGSLLSTSSAITLIDNYLLIGGKMKKFLSCRLTDPLYA